MLGDSGLLQQLQWYARSPAGHPMCIYGDPAYPLRVQLQAPFRNVVLTPQMQAFNSSMSSVRSCVEWLFGDIVNYFKFIDSKKNLKIIWQDRFVDRELLGFTISILVVVTLVELDNILLVPPEKWELFIHRPRRVELGIDISSTVCRGRFVHRGRSRYRAR